MNGFWLAALVRSALFLVVPGLLVRVFVAPPRSPLHQYSSIFSAFLLALLVYVVSSTLNRYLARRRGVLSVADQVAAVEASQPVETVRLRR